MRQFSYVTVGQILKRLREDGINIARTTFYNLEADGIFQSDRSTGTWRVYSEAEADLIIKLIKENYKKAKLSEIV